MGNFEIEESEIRYKKRTESNVSKSDKKSDHKHEYEDILLYGKKESKFCRATACKICGKVKDIKFIETEKVKGKPYSVMLDSSEIYNKYKDKCKIYTVETIWAVDKLNLNT